MKLFQRLVEFLAVAHKGLTEKSFLYSELVANYEDYHESTHISPMSSIRLKLISDWIEPKSSVLDVGCGEGFTMEYLHKYKQCKILGMDVSNRIIAKARTKGFECIERDVDSEGLELTAEMKYDYVLFVEVLEHLKYPHKVLVQACEHAKKGVVATLPNSGYLYWRLQMLRGHFPRQSFTHLHFWSINDFYIFLRQLNLKPIALKTDLPSHGLKNIIMWSFKNLLAYQQCWLIAPKQ